MISFTTKYICKLKATYPAVGADNKVERLVEPAVGTIPVKHGTGIVIKTLLVTLETRRITVDIIENTTEIKFLF